MNTLGYVARHFAPRPPAAPSDADKPIPRVNTWSTRSLLFPHTAPRRAHSSPSLAISHPQSQQETRSKPQIESAFDRIFVIRVLLFLWDRLKLAWSSLTDHYLAWRHLFTPRQLVHIEATARTRELDSSEPKQPVSDPPPPTEPTQPPTDQPASRSPRKTPFHLPKTLVLDLDETLIHSTSRPILAAAGSNFLGFGKTKNPGHMVEVVMEGRSTLYHVYKRPFVDFFLRTVSGWYTLVIFTASMQEYADPVIDWLDAGRGILSHRLFRDVSIYFPERFPTSSPLSPDNIPTPSVPVTPTPKKSCTQLPNGSYTKDLSLVEADLSRVCLIDNSPVSYNVNPANGIPIEGWTHDPYDEALLDLLPLLDSLRFTKDIRHVLGLRTFGQHRKS